LIAEVGVNIDFQVLPIYASGQGSVRAIMKVQASVTQATLDRQIVGYAVHLFRLQMRLLNANSLIWLWSIVGFAARRTKKGNSGSCSPHPDGALSHAAQNSPIKTWEQAILIASTAAHFAPIATPS